MDNNSLDYKAIVKFLSIYKDDESLRSFFLRRFDHPDKLSWYDEETTYKFDFLFVDESDNKKFWIDSFSDYSYLYIYASLSNWSEVFKNGIIIKTRCDEYREKFSKEIKSNIEQLLLKVNESIIPSGMIKLAICLRIKTSLFANTETVSQNNQDEIVKCVLDKAADDFDILRKNQSQLEYIDQLSLASHIRDAIVNDERVTKLCTVSDDATSLRKKILDDIKMFQLSIIDSVLKNDKFLNTNLDGSVNDFNHAKKNLCNLAKKELDSSKPINNNRHPLLLDDPQFLSHIDHLSEVVENCSNERYRILIMGEYQSGKTTFIDAINGKHIGAIGNGDTTSAVPIEMTYAEEANVIPLMKSKKDLTELLSSIQKYIEDFSIDNFDLDNKNDRDTLYEKLNVLRYDKEKCPKVKEPGLKVLAICALILKYYGNEQLKGLTSDSVKLEQIAMFSSFPERVETRWRKKGADDFSFDEAVFAFVRKFQCFIPSDNLRQLNCTFVDSPGLFSNDYDTQVTEKEMKEANAILYLLPHDKAVGEDTCGSLYILRNNHPNFLRKLFLVNNRSFIDQKRFYETNREVVKEMFGPAMELYKVDARLAYLGSIKDSFDNNKLSDDEKNNFILSCQNATEEENPEENVSMNFNNFMEAWDYCIYLYKRTLLHCDSDKMPMAKDVIDRSKMSNILKKLLAFIENNMVYSLIVSEGIHKLYNELESIRKSLILQYVKPYLVDKINLENEWENRFCIASEFSESAKPIINKHFFEVIDETPSLHNRLSKIAYSTIFPEDSIDLMIVSICRKIYSLKWKIARCGRNKSRIKDLITPEVNKLLDNFITDRIKEHWNDLLLNGQNQVFSDPFISEIKLIEVELDSLWKDLFANDDDFLSARNIYYEVSKDTSKLTIGVSENDVKDFSTGSVPLMGPILNEIAAITAGILALLTPTILSIALAVTSNPLGWAVAGAAAILGGGYYAVTGDDWMETRFIKSQAPKIKKKLSEQELNKKLNDLIENEVKKILTEYASGLCINKKRMNDEHDVALSTPEEEKENNCYASLKEIVDINDYISDYVKFCNLHIDYA